MKLLPSLFLVSGLLLAAAVSVTAVPALIGLPENGRVLPFSVMLTVMLFAELLAVVGVLGLVRSLVHQSAAGPRPGGQSRWRRVALHLSALSVYAGLPLGQLWLPFLLWRSWSRLSTPLDDEGRAVINFALSTTLYLLIAMLLTLVLVGFVLVITLMVFHISMILINSLRVVRGVPTRYRFCFDFFN